MITTVFSEATHGFCGFHMKNNVNITYKNPHVTTLFVNASRVYHRDKFSELMEELMVVKPNAFVKLMEDDVRKCPGAYYPVQRYNLMTTNIVESINSTLRHACKLPITPLMESIRDMLQTWFHVMRNEAERITTPLTQPTSSIIRKNSDAFEYYFVELVDNFIYHVKDETKDRVVNLSTKTCICRKFNLNLILCSHACATIKYVYNHFLYLCML